MGETKKVVYTRDGVDREYTEREVQIFQPQLNGWKLKSESETSGEEAARKAAEEARKNAEAEEAAKAAELQAKKDEEEAARKAAEGSGEVSIEGKTSKDFKGTDVEAIAPLLKSLTKEQIETFFADEDRQFMNKLKNDLLNEGGQNG